MTEEVLAGFNRGLPLHKADGPRGGLPQLRQAAFLLPIRATPYYQPCCAKPRMAEGSK